MFSYGSHPRGKPEAFFIEINTFHFQRKEVRRWLYALNALPQDNRDILLMYWFLEMADREIAERMNLARRTINNRRLKSYRLLKELMGGDTDA